MVSNFLAGAKMLIVEAWCRKIWNVMIGKLLTIIKTWFSTKALINFMNASD